MKNKEVDVAYLVEVKTQKSIEKGILMPSSDDKAIFLKLDSGYNIGIKKSKIKSIKKLKKVPLEKPIKCAIKHNPKLKKITILHTGGTVASKVSYSTGGVTARFSPEEILCMFPELESIANIDSRLIANIYSGNINFHHYNQIAKEISKEIKKGVDGIIITHGTDTLHYTAAALSFMLEHSPIPIVLVASQRSSDRGSTDAALNLYCAAKFIAETSFADVAICMHSSTSDNSCFIHQGTKVRKMHTSRRDTFQSINIKPWAEVSRNKIQFLRTNYRKLDKNRKFNLKLMKENLKIGIIKSHPHMHASELKPYSTFNGLILEGTGLGHFPIIKYDAHTSENQKIFNEIKKLSKKMPVVMTSQCVYGSINMNVYDYGRLLQQAGVIGNFHDMTPETAFIKLSWLLSNYPKTKVRELMLQNLRGEIEKTSQNEKIFS
jgi:glutamyl-tRNA(Gln) amidotransferase subunit D